ncbi:ABC transporter permease, partial [Dermabacteraceae bacterium P13101]
MSQLVRKIGRSDVTVVVLAFFFAFLIGSILIIAVNPQVHESLGYFFARPQDTLVAAWGAVSEAYVSMFRGSIFNYRANSFDRMIKPLLETLTVATPLIIASVGIAIAFRAGLFNI